MYGVFFLEALHSFASTRVAWALLCDGWGDPAALRRVGWQDVLVPLLSGVGTSIWVSIYTSSLIWLEVAAWVQLFYVWRIKVLGASRLWTILAMSIVPVSHSSYRFIFFSLAHLYS